MWPQLLQEWEAKEKERQDAIASVSGGLPDAAAAAEPQYIAYVPLPDEKEIEQRVLQKKKADLMAKYSTPALQKQQQEARALLSGQ